MSCIQIVLEWILKRGKESCSLPSPTKRGRQKDACESKSAYFNQLTQAKSHGEEKIKLMTHSLALNQDLMVGISNGYEMVIGRSNSSPRSLVNSIEMAFIAWRQAFVEAKVSKVAAKADCLQRSTSMIICEKTLDSQGPITIASRRSFLSPTISYALGFCRYISRIFLAVPFHAWHTEFKRSKQFTQGGQEATLLLLLRVGWRENEIMCLRFVMKCTFVAWVYNWRMSKSEIKDAALEDMTRSYSKERREHARCSMSRARLQTELEAAHASISMLEGENKLLREQLKPSDLGSKAQSASTEIPSEGSTTLWSKIEESNSNYISQTANVPLQKRTPYEALGGFVGDRIKQHFMHSLSDTRTESSCIPSTELGIPGHSGMVDQAPQSGLLDQAPQQNIIQHISKTIKSNPQSGTPTSSSDTVHINASGSILHGRSSLEALKDPSLVHAAHAAITTMPYRQRSQEVVRLTSLGTRVVQNVAGIQTPTVTPRAIMSPMRSPRVVQSGVATPRVMQIRAGLHEAPRSPNANVRHQW